jgi:cob(I)alamin adenosyltransferase
MADAATPPTEGPAPARVRAPSRVLVHTGKGKGKTSAAMGVVMRAVARDWRVVVVQFVKDGRWRTGEESSARVLGVEWWSAGDGFTWDSTDMERSEAVARAAWSDARAMIAGGDYQLVVLDEITYPMNWGWISTDDVVATLRGRPAKVNVVATGRDAPAPLIELADTVTEMRKVKHAYETGVRARRGLDF